MCGRFVLSSPVDLLVELFGLAHRPSLEPRYNIAPTQCAAVVRAGAGSSSARRLDQLRWGLVPRWAENVSVGARIINARSETASTKRAFRDAFARRRCLVPADAFYEWRTIGTLKHPYAIRRQAGGPFAMAGLWEHRQDPGAADSDAPLETFTILTTTPNEIVAPLHDRMPVIIGERDFARWLDPDLCDADAVHDLLTPASADSFTAYPVSRIVNKPDNDEPACLEPVEEPVEPTTPDDAQGSLFG